MDYFYRLTISGLNQVENLRLSHFKTHSKLLYRYIFNPHFGVQYQCLYSSVAQSLYVVKHPNLVLFLSTALPV